MPQAAHQPHLRRHPARATRETLEPAARRAAAGSASWLIKNVQQRFDTILRVSQAIVERQRHFFEHGEVAMRPLVLREIADMLGLHESTISRVTTQKYMPTPRGTFELKYFFGSHVATDTGGAASRTAIRALIKQLVAAEDAEEAAVRQPDRGDARRAGHRGRAPHGREVPRGAADSAGQPAQGALSRSVRTFGRDYRKEELDESEPHRPSSRHHAGDPRLRRRQARPRQPAFRPRDRRQRGPVGGQAATEGRSERARARQGHPRRERSTPTCTRRSTCWPTSSTARC